MAIRRLRALAILGAGLGLSWGCSVGTGAEDGEIVCDYGDGLMCTCADGSESVRWCSLDGSGYGPCECGEGGEGFADEVGTEAGDEDGSTDEGTSGGEETSGSEGSTDEGTSEGESEGGEGSEDSTGESSTGGEDTTTGGEEFDAACFPGPNEDGGVCLPLVAPSPTPDCYAYPGLYMGNVNYRAPVRYIDLEAVDPSTQVAPNFTLDELAQSYKGRYAVVQPHAVERIQDLRDLVGPIVVNSGYRPPCYNEMIGGATWSRHQYGDGFDLDPVNVGLSTLEAACSDNAGFLVEYETHVHCDWRGVDVDPAFFGYPDAQTPLDVASAMHASLSFDAGEGRWRAPSVGFEEGEPLRRWSAWDGQGALIAEGRGRSFEAPEGTARVEVIVGAQLHLEVELP
ncbi:hypothetical protein G6O69_21610 [Pseudenhygromyxa sp. WMMC2535]|uniref:D-Ala-D-Ala carboxypeptidase family metallohydrolase n=1 Tax=Pseudenhygromyxa sp. WMMC2535 TaxID=2712867 RepID=UPI0015575805|nr:D-Ala-D-Ala carboxypeptidase family metallohydrolase [Pseudenhygromyxa sp. WMMC2535]NVB40452.1 hypothetical protein [Pseudenhygromyxa sp. WMMC2535]